MHLTRDTFSQLCARWLPHPYVFVHLRVEGSEPWSHASRITAIELAGVTHTRSIAGGVVAITGGDSAVLADLLTYISTPSLGVRLISDDGESTPAWVAAKWPDARPVWAGALRLARLLRLTEPARVQEPFVLEQPGSMPGAALALALAEDLSLAEDGQEGVYGDSVAVSAMLATQTVRGYHMTDGVVHPRWTVLSDAGHPVITARKPALVSMPHTARASYPAPPGLSWVRLGWQQPELRLWAVLSKDPAFAVLVRATDPYAALGEGTSVSREDLRRGLYHYLHGLPPDDTIATEIARRCCTLFPDLTRYREAVVAAVSRGDRVYGWHYRRLLVDGRVGGTPPLRRLGQHAQATAMNVALLRLMGSDPAAHAMSQVIPVFDTVAYCTARPDDLQDAIDAFSIDLGLAGDGASMRMRTTAMVGNTWGSVASPHLVGA